jgi:LysM repeat protein
MSDKYTIK